MTQIRSIHSLIVALTMTGCSSQIAAQRSVVPACDTTELRLILNTVLKAEMRNYDREYLFDQQAVPHHRGRGPWRDRPSSECEEFTSWPSHWVTFKKLKAVPRDSIKHMDYSIFISRPSFSASGNECAVVYSMHSSEWGGSTRFVYLKKRGRKWKRVRVSLVSVS
jgi:hypothetical protein